MSEPTKRLRCAVYTRKSSEEGLEQEFNSLDAQREAGEAYVLAQKHEGWELLSDRYDDGGFSGGSMERPGLKRLLEDVEAGRIDIVVVYKVDRLSRSLGDFSQMVSLFDQHQASFVSVTQQFNTTSSMGRLTLNILLSFAQFEREVTGERIRDKIAASKKKGMWMGGYAPLGYDVASRKLLINDAEAQLIDRIFTRFVRLGSTTILCKELNDRGYRTKTYRGRNGRLLGGHTFTKTTLYKILNNRIYLGEIRHKDKWYPGEHCAVIDQGLWEKVHAIMATNPTKRGHDTKRQTPAPLKGLLFGPDGLAMTPSHSRKRDKIYRYYVTSTANKKGYEECPIRAVRAGDIEGIVFDQIKTIFKKPAMIVRCWKEASQQDATLTEQDVRTQLQAIETVWDHLFHREQARLMHLFIEKIRVESEGIHIDVRTNGLHSLVMDLKSAAHKAKEKNA